MVDANAEAGASFEAIERRLSEQIAVLVTQSNQLNARRSELFGATRFEVVHAGRVRTEHNAIPRDMVGVGNHLVFAFQVNFGLKQVPVMSDLFALYKYSAAEDAKAEELLPVNLDGSFLDDATFKKDFLDAFRYGKGSQVLKLKRTEKRLLVVLQIGEAITDVRVFRFAIDPRGSVTYMDGRGEEDNVDPASHSFDWIRAGREMQVSGAHPHINILDQIFVETIGGNLTVKIENNTATGKGIYEEPVVDPNQTLDDGEISYARLGQLIFLKVKPYREEQIRYFVFNLLSKRVHRIDAIGQACVALPEDQGVIFPGGYLVASGETRVFDAALSGMQFETTIRSPNGEDCLYTFYHPARGEYMHIPYNVITKEAATPIRCHGSTLRSDGTLCLFRVGAEAEASRVHPIQIWITPFLSADLAAQTVRQDSYLAKVGNTELVRGLSDLASVRRLAESPKQTRKMFEELVRVAQKAIDDHYWLGNEEAFSLLTILTDVRRTATQALEEFEKVAELKAASQRLAEEAKNQVREHLRVERPEDSPSAESYLGSLGRLRLALGQVIGLQDTRYVDREALAVLEKSLRNRIDELSRNCLGFFQVPESWQSIEQSLEASSGRIATRGKAAELSSEHAELQALTQNLVALGETISAIEVEDATIRTAVLEHLARVTSVGNRVRAQLDARKRDLLATEGRAELAVQLGVLSQATSSAIANATDPEACDAALARLLMRLEELSGRFGDVEAFAAELLTRREELSEAFSAKRQSLADARLQKAAILTSSAARILGSVQKKADSFSNDAELAAYFASDPMVQKAQDIAKSLEAIGDTVRAEELSSQLKTAKQDAVRKLRDRRELQDGGNVRLGSHRFAMTRQAVDLVLVPRDNVLHLHLTGTDFYEPLHDPELQALNDVWEQTLISENASVYRSEFLAYELFLKAKQDATEEANLRTRLREGTLLPLVSEAASTRLEEGYERGVHDADATKILSALLREDTVAGAMRYTDLARGAVILWMLFEPESELVLRMRRASALSRVATLFGQRAELDALAQEVTESVARFAGTSGLIAADKDAFLMNGAGQYFVEAAQAGSILCSQAAFDASRKLRQDLETHSAFIDVCKEWAILDRRPLECLQFAMAYGKVAFPADFGLAIECGALFAVSLREFSLWAGTRANEIGLWLRNQAPMQAGSGELCSELLGAHARIEGGKLAFRLSEFLTRLDQHAREVAPRFRAYRAQRSKILDGERKRLRLSEFQPRVLSSFVRNRLIDEVYLNLVGANFAKQLGAAGDDKRTDRMGLLLLISPPGYGKTTLMEYVAHTLGLVFVKVNGPALGHDVRSLDPDACPSLTARQEVERINLAFEMGNNVMLYLDDVQHTSPEFLEKFISLCDGQRRIEGVYKGVTRTYDFRGKRFCIVMAANPYTETGARFKIPDMLANRADTHNLGEVLSGKDDLFALSYIENALTSHPVLSPLGTRDPKDVARLVRMADGDASMQGELSHPYGAAELEEVLRLLRLCKRVQSVLLAVNATYIRSASQDDAYRTEPSFKLQGSYRNMNKIVQKLAPVMTVEEVERTVSEHYQGEAQTLTTGAEQNLLKLRELRGMLSADEKERWEQIKASYVRNARGGKAGDDPVSRITSTLGGLEEQLSQIQRVISQYGQRASEEQVKERAKEQPERALSLHTEALVARFESLAAELRKFASPKVQVSVATPNPQVLELEAIEQFARSVAQEFQSMRPDGAAPATDIAEKLNQLERTLSRVSTTPLRVSADLRVRDATNFYSDAAGTLLGVFVATYSKAPPLRTPLTVQLVFPGDATFDVVGTVSFFQDEDGDRPAGYGVQLGQVPVAAGDLIRKYAASRAPVLYDLDK
jgi:ATPase involved in DNA repair/ATPase family associated with various cellular activities (AAA)